LPWNGKKSSQRDVAAVVLKPDWRAPGINDSKQVPPERRAELALLIEREARAWAVAFVEPDEIDRINIYWAGIAAYGGTAHAQSIDARSVPSVKRWVCRRSTESRRRLAPLGVSPRGTVDAGAPRG
jgi:ribonuclease HII